MRDSMTHAATPQQMLDARKPCRILSARRAADESREGGLIIDGHKNVAASDMILVESDRLKGCQRFMTRTQS